MNLILKSKKSIIAAGILAVVLILGMGIHYYLNTPQNVISLDVNPSIEIHTNRLGYVVSIDPVNDDAATVMAGYQLKNKDLETVIGDIVDRLILNGYLVTEDTNEILVSANNTDSSQNILGKVTSVINTYLKNKQLNVTVLNQTLDADSEDSKAAHANKVSVGKMAVINKIMDTNKDVTVEDLSDDSVKELMQYFNNADISTEELAQNYAIVPSVTPAVAKDAQEQDDTEIEDDRDGASVAATNSDIEDNEDNDDNDDAEINENNEDNKVTINVGTASTAKSSSESKKHKNNSSLAAKASDIENENEDSQNEDSITKDDNDSYDKEDQDNDNDSQIKEDNDYDDDEDADYEDTSEYDSEEENDDYSYEDSEDKEDSSDKEDSYEQNNTEDGHYGSHYESDDQGEDD